MYWVFLFFGLVILSLVFYVHSVKAEKDSHNWHTESEPIDEKLKSRMQELACCHTVFYYSTDPAEIEKVYEEARKRGEREGFFPVLVTLEESLVRTLTHRLGLKDDEHEIDVANVQERRQELMQTIENGKDWLDTRFRKFQHDFEAESPDFYRMDVLGEHTSDGEGFTSFKGIVNDETGSTLPLLLAEVPVEQPWQVLAWFPFGGTNVCPAAEHIVSVAKYWFERYGAVPAVIAHGIIEFALSKPVVEEDSLPLAKEHYAFCSDMFDQGVGTINAWADVLRKSTVWFFGWD